MGKGPEEYFTGLDISRLFESDDRKSIATKFLVLQLSEAKDGVQVKDVKGSIDSQFSDEEVRDIWGIYGEKGIDEIFNRLRDTGLIERKKDNSFEHILTQRGKELLYLYQEMVLILNKAKDIESEESKISAISMINSTRDKPIQEVLSEESKEDLIRSDLRDEKGGVDDAFVSNNLFGDKAKEIIDISVQKINLSSSRLDFLNRIGKLEVEERLRYEDGKIDQMMGIEIDEILNEISTIKFDKMDDIEFEEEDVDTDKYGFLDD